MKDMTREEYESLLMKAVDGLATEDEMARLDAWWARHPDDREEFEDFVGIKQTTDILRDRLAASADIEPPREPVAQRKAVGMATALMLTGMVIYLGFGAWMFLSAPDVPMALKISFGLVGAAGLILFTIALRTRIRAAGRDPYSEIDQ